MYPKPHFLNGVGLVQFLLAASFVVWLLYPGGGAAFAWPVTPAVTAWFLAVSFILRSALGFAIWREKYWYRLRLMVWGNYAFLTVIFAATFLHLGEMSWKTHGILAHVWVLAYIFEPLILILREPRDPESRAPVTPERRGGPLFSGLKHTLTGIYILGVTVAGILFINPAFADIRWPWALNPFDSQIMAAWPAACAVWAFSLCSAKDWAEAKLGVQLLLLYATSLFAFWVVTFPGYDPARVNRIPFGVVVGVLVISLAYYYFRQEAARRRVGLPLAAATAAEGHAMGSSPS